MTIFLNSEKLKEVHDNTDWRDVFNVLELKKDEKRSKPDDWWAFSPFRDEKTPSFHMNKDGYYDFGETDEKKKKGGVIELYQNVIKYRTGEALNCYEVGRIFIDKGLSYLNDSKQKAGKAEDRDEKTQEEVKKEKGKVFDGIKEKSQEVKSDEQKNLKSEVKENEIEKNKPINVDLKPVLITEHEELKNRGISKETCEFLGCGFLEKSKYPLKERIVFQIRGVQEDKKGNLKPVILCHVGRALTKEQEEIHGKWWFFKGFNKSLELYNIDKLLLDEESKKQAQERGYIIISEGCFDTAKLFEAGIKNTVSTMGSKLLKGQIDKLEYISEKIGVKRILVWYDRDKAGIKAQENTVNNLILEGFEAVGFDWEKGFDSGKRKNVKIPDNIKDPCDFSIDQLQWFRKKEII